MDFPYTGRRLTGVLVPLSALRSKSSYGVGEIPDLIDLARWAKQCGLELIQILPINDTGGQSSPYSALSAFALHPIYLRIQELPEYQGAAEEVRKEINRRIDRLRKAHETPAPDGYKRSALAYRELYEEKLDLLTLLFDTAPEEALSSQEIEQWAEKNPWVEPYAVYRTIKQSQKNRSWTDWDALRNPDRETIERFWSAPENRRSTRFWAWLQLRLEQQMQSVAVAADNLGVALKGDLPILMNEDSVDVWANREIFIQELRAGAPPDMFSYLGQNWDFPIYNWKEMRRREYSWWKERLRQAEKFYHAFRIDHVLGFFRIWAIPETHFSGLPGYFYPSEQMSREELHGIGFDDGRIRWLAEPHLEGFRIRELVGAENPELREKLFTPIDGEDLFRFSEQITGERAITEIAFQYALSEEQTSSLLTEYRNRALIPTVDGKLAATWNFRECNRFQTLTEEERSAFETIVAEKQERSEELWEAQGRELLSMMREEVAMLPCAEDLGVVPPSVPRTLEKLDVLGLIIPRWSRLWDQPGQPFVHPRDYTELSVCAPSVHDTSTMRVWWEEEEGGADFWDALELEGEPSERFDSATARAIYRAFQQGSPRICVYQIQDFFALAPELLDPEPKRERVNVPGTYNDVNWSWRMPIDIEKLITMKDLTEELQELVTYRDPGLRGEKREFHVSRAARDRYEFDEELFSSRGYVVFPNTHGAQRFAHRINRKREEAAGEYAQAGDLYAMGLIDEVFHYLVGLYRDQYGDGVFAALMDHLEERFGEKELEKSLERFATDFPTTEVYREERTPKEQLDADVDGIPGRQIAMEELIMLWLSNLNPAFSPYADLFSDAALRRDTKYGELALEVEKYFEKQPGFGPNDQSLVELLREPAIEHPDSLQSQLEFIRRKWGSLLGAFFARLLRGIDLIREEHTQRGGPGGPGPTEVLRFGAAAGEELEAERFSPDREWMPKVVLLAKSTLVWLSQLTDQYKRPIRRLDEIPDETLDQIAMRGFNALWLIGLWERSGASRRIKQLTGNPEAAASAYALYDYEIAGELGGWEALESLRRRCMRRGIRLASDMVPNHTGIDSRWVHEHPDWYVQTDYSPYPTYSFTGENLSSREGIGIYLEDHYYDRTDAAVVFKRVDEGSGRERYIYHGNDGTSMPWNDTAQLDFLNPEVREAVVQHILHVARNFPVIRFDAAMTLAKKHIQRLWCPQPGAGGAIPSRADHAITQEEFDLRIPKEFWREVVDRVAQEIPDTLLLAEAFWMMEGYFVRTLGMHRVYNSAFMNMLKNEENAKYRQTIKNTLEFDPEILKRFVNFMNNPDEDTAVAQFGKEDKYFGVCTLMVTMPGLPMFGHGQVEGFEEKYGMEYTRAYKQETPDLALEARHNREIFPLLHKRYVFAESENFRLYDLFTESGSVNENVFAYTNGAGTERAFVLYNNFWEETWGWIKGSAGYIVKEDGAKVRRSTTLAEGLTLHRDYHHYCILREQRTGLWFIRNSGELHEQGLFVHLSGYQTQVFTDIYEAADNEYAHYAQLADSLGGAGTPDINRALVEVSLKPLHDAFARPLNSGTARIIVHEFLRRGEAMDFRLLAEEYRSFLAIAQEFTDRATDVERGITEFTSLTNGLARMRQLATLYERQSEIKPSGGSAADSEAAPAEGGVAPAGNGSAPSGAGKRGATARSGRLSVK
ncbi:MAG: 4-alpha-glucanotransferase, partial [Spirochaetaceae bacterium]